MNTMTGVMANQGKKGDDPWLVQTPRSQRARRSAVPASVGAVTILAPLMDRIGAIIVNDGQAVLYLAFGDKASTTDYTVKILANGVYEVPFVYAGLITGVWASASGTARITELLT